MRSRVTAVRGDVVLLRVPISFPRKHGKTRTMRSLQVRVTRLKAMPFSPLSTSSWYCLLPQSANDDQMLGVENVQISAYQTTSQLYIVSHESSLTHL